VGSSRAGAVLVGEDYSVALDVATWFSDKPTVRPGGVL
jgi:hypothetical protein